MKKKFGEWLLDISKYMTTAILLSSIFTDFGGSWLYILIIVTILSTLAGGLFLTREQNRKEEK